MRRKILLVDDEPVVLEILGKKLEQRNFDVYTARDGTEGLECAKSVHPDLILLDELMPRKDGLAMLKELKEDEKLVGIPVIMVTARRAQRERTKAEEAGVIAYITKPASLFEILKYIEWYMQAS